MGGLVCLLHGDPIGAVLTLAPMASPVCTRGSELWRVSFTTCEGGFPSGWVLSLTCRRLGLDGKKSGGGDRGGGVVGGGGSGQSTEIEEWGRE